jgi:hypothetical protein
MLNPKEKHAEVDSTVDISSPFTIHLGSNTMVGPYARCKGYYSMSAWV